MTIAQREREKMQRLIDANELWGQIYKLATKHRWKNRTNIAFNKCLDAIQFFPTVDAVEVVRCKDCKWGEYCDDFLPTEDDGFCSWGERKEDAETN